MKEQKQARESVSSSAPGTLQWLVDIMRRLLAPDGCPWDREQTLESLKPFLLEESYEVLDAIDEQSPAHHREELGDVFFQIVFQAEVAGHAMGDVIQGIGDKLIRRHPHVFGDVQVDGTREVLANWEQIKSEERGGEGGVLSGVPRSMPALPRCLKLTHKAAKVGFDWPDAGGARDKIAEELGELDRAVEGGDTREMDHELGDLLLAVSNWARKLELDPEAALERANRRFERRFGHIEAALAERGKTPARSTLEEMDRLWDEAKERLEQSQKEQG